MPLSRQEWQADGHEPAGGTCVKRGLSSVRRALRAEDSGVFIASCHNAHASRQEAGSPNQVFPNAACQHENGRQGRHSSTDVAPNPTPAFHLPYHPKINNPNSLHPATSQKRPPGGRFFYPLSPLGTARPPVSQVYCTPTAHAQRSRGRRDSGEYLVLLSHPSSGTRPSIAARWPEVWLSRQVLLSCVAHNAVPVQPNNCRALCGSEVSDLCGGL